MKTDGTDALSFITILARNGEMIAETYRLGSIEVTDENRSKVHELNTAGLLTPFRAGNFRLSRSMRALLDDGTKRQRGYATGSNLGAEMARFRALLVDYQLAAAEGRMEDAQRHEEDLLDSIFEIQDAVSGDLGQYLQITQSNYSDVRNAEEKARQNEHYLRRAKALEAALADLNSRETLDLFQSPLVREIEDIWHSEISLHIRTWTAKLLDAIDILKTFLFSYREIARETRRLRVFERLLRHRSDAEILETLAAAEDQPWSRRVSQGIAQPFPDIVTPEGRDALAEMARDLKPLAPREVKARERGQRRSEPDVVLAEEQLSPEEEMLAAFLTVVDQAGSWVSAADWSRQVNKAETQSFLEKILTWSYSDRACGRKAEMKFCEKTDDRSGNIEVRDILVCPAA